MPSNFGNSSSSNNQIGFDDTTAFYADYSKFIVQDKVVENTVVDNEVNNLFADTYVDGEAPVEEYVPDSFFYSIFDTTEFFSQNSSDDVSNIFYVNDEVPVKSKFKFEG